MGTQRPTPKELAYQHNGPEYGSHNDVRRNFLHLLIDSGYLVNVHRDDIKDARRLAQELTPFEFDKPLRNEALDYWDGWNACRKAVLALGDQPS